MEIILIMEIKGKVFCFFEQSGTFKKQFRALGYSACDYDIRNDFGETDVIIDLFAEIESAFSGEKSIFDAIDSRDLIIAFFPCTYFCENNRLFFRAQHVNLERLDKMSRAQEILRRAANREKFYSLALKFFVVCDVKNLRLVCENPFSTQHYLWNNFPYAPKFIDKNRRARGDFYRKPTMYWFVNCEPGYGMSDYQVVIPRNVANSSGTTQRSMISAAYARAFILDNILGVNCLF